MSKKLINRRTAIIGIATLIFLSIPQQTQASDFWTGNGGSGIRLTVFEPEGRRLSKDEQWMLSLIQHSITGDFNKFSAMTILDRQNLERVMAQWKEQESGHYSDEDRIRIGNLTNASHILSGTLTKTPNALMLELSVTDLANGQRRASYPPRPVSPRMIENLSAIKEATVDLLGQLGVTLTAKGLEELKGITAARIQAEAALARGIVAQRQGTEVAALSYYFMAAELDASLLEAVSRSSIITANISSGNIGEDTRNEIAWRKQWIDRLTETEQHFNQLFNANPLPYTLFYSKEIIPGAINYQTETRTLSINTNLRATGAWAWLSSVERALQAVYDGLDATGRKQVWGLQNWPWTGVTNLKPFERKQHHFTITIELANSRNAVIGRTEFQSGGAWGFNGRGRPHIETSGDDRKQIHFRNVRADDITDDLTTIRIASVNGMNASIAAQTGVLQIKAISKEEWDSYTSFTMRRNIVTGYNGSGGSLVIPSNIWSEPDIGIVGIGGTSGQRHGRPTNNRPQFTQVIIPRSVTSIGANTFNVNTLTRVIMPRGVAITDNSFSHDFAAIYRMKGEGIYELSGTRWYRLIGGSYDEAVRTQGARLRTAEEEARLAEEERIRQIREAEEEARRAEEERIWQIRLAEEERARRIRDAEEEARRAEEERIRQIVLAEEERLRRIREAEEEAKRIKTLRAAWRMGMEFPIVGGNVKFLMQEINPYYTTGYNFNIFIPTSIEFCKGNFRFLRFGLDLDLFGGVEPDREQIRKDMADVYDNIGDIQTGVFTGTGKVGAIVRLYPIDAFYLSGGYGLGWYRDWSGKTPSGEKIKGEQGTVVAPVTSLGAGLFIIRNRNDDGVGGIFVNTHYNIVHLSDRTAGYWTVGFGIKGDGRLGAYGQR